MRTFLGVDVGTTTSKVCLIDENERIIEEISESHNSTIKSPNPRLSEQCPKTIVQHLYGLISRLDTSDLSAICTSGQMHGIMFWNSNANYSDNVDEWPCSRLITWMDQRLDAEFLSKMPRWINDGVEQRMSTGYGLASLLWLQENKLLSTEWNCCGSIMDFFNFLLTNESGVISDQIAYSFGYFMNDKTWQPNVCKMIPNNLLPKIVSPGYELGFLKTNRMKCQRKDVRVYVSVGDLQASLFKVLKEKEAVLQISTSSQLIFLSPKLIPSTELPDSLLQTPYFNGKKLVVAASLNGGNVFELLIQKITNFYDELYDQRTERKCSENKIGDILNEFNSSAQPLRVLPLFYGERHLPYKGAIIDNLSASTTLSDLFGSTAVGIVKNLSEMMSEKYMRDFEVSRLRLLNRATHSIFRDEAKKSFPNSEIIVDEQSLLSAAYGSAVHALQQSMTSK